MRPFVVLSSQHAQDNEGLRIGAARDCPHVAWFCALFMVCVLNHDLKFVYWFVVLGALVHQNSPMHTKA